MLIVISPAKTLDYETPLTIKKATKPQFLEDSTLLVEQLRRMKPGRIAKLMHISPQLAALTSNRYMDWHTPFTKHNSRQSLLAFKGDVYVGLDAGTLGDNELEFAQRHLRILSGLYGVLRPLDLMQAYRLEMGTELKNLRGKDLYEFWGDKITGAIKKDLKRQNVNLLVNLASSEYFSSINEKGLGARVITPVFKEKKGGNYRFLSFYGKKARGLMCRFIICNGITAADDLKGFDLEGYGYNKNLSEGDNWVFTRNAPKK